MQQVAVALIHKWFLTAAFNAYVLWTRHGVCRRHHTCTAGSQWFRISGFGTVNNLIRLAYLTFAVEESTSPICDAREYAMLCSDMRGGCTARYDVMQQRVPSVQGYTTSQHENQTREVTWPRGWTKGCCVTSTWSTDPCIFV
jgi:hypothetical protein